MSYVPWKTVICFFIIAIFLLPDVEKKFCIPGGWLYVHNTSTFLSVFDISINVDFSSKYMNLVHMLSQLTPFPIVSINILSNNRLSMEASRMYLKPWHTDVVSCYNLSVATYLSDISPKVCLSSSSGWYYGGAASYQQYWPIKVERPLEFQPYIMSDYLSGGKDAFGSVLEPYWLSANGIAVFVDRMSPVHVKYDIRKSSGKRSGINLCFLSQFQDSPYQHVSRNRNNSLDIVVCNARHSNTSLRQVHLTMANLFFSRPSSIPNKRMFREPIWSTWAKYKTNVNQEKVLQFAKDIRQHNFSGGQLEIDDFYTKSYGDWEWDSIKFSNAKQMVEQLHNANFKITSWVHPFANVESDAFAEGLRAGHLLKDVGTKEAALVRWWQGHGAVVDVTCVKGSAWFERRLRTNLVESGVDSFKFDAGEHTFLPSGFVGAQPLDNPNYFAAHYVRFASRFGNMIEVRVGYDSQQYPAFVRILDLDSHWGYDNGLQSLIPHCLQMSLVGYPFVLPDMIGGNGYVRDGAGNIIVNSTALPDRELYIRWLQVSAFLPAMQFSVAPWDYDSEVVSIAQKYVGLHEQLVTPIVVDAAERFVKTGEPIVKPLWWFEHNVVNSDNSDVFQIDQQFVVGDSLLVAPVVQPSSTSRSLYLPKGLWKDIESGDAFHGPAWLSDYNVPLQRIAVFRRLPDS